MTKTLLTSLSSLLLSSLASLSAEPVLEAARRMSETKSYSWSTTSQDAQGSFDSRQGPTHGKAQKDGPIHVTFTLGDSMIELAFHQDKYAIKYNDSWHGKDDLTGDQNWIADRLATYKPAHEEAAFLATHSQLNPTDNTGEFAGPLQPEALRYLLSRGRHEVNDVDAIRGRAIFWIREGQLEKYQYSLQGPVPFGPDNGIVQLNRTTTVEFKNLDTTEVNPPEEAWKKIR